MNTPSRLPSGKDKPPCFIGYIGALSTPEGRNQIMARLSASEAQIEAFCTKWHISEMALFGSVLTNDFNEESDIDVLVRYEDPQHDSFATFMDAADELESLFRRKTDFIAKRTLDHNPFNRETAADILARAEVLYPTA